MLVAADPTGVVLVAVAAEVAVAVTMVTAPASLDVPVARAPVVPVAVDGLAVLAVAVPCALGPTAAAAILTVGDAEVVAAAASAADAEDALGSAALAAPATPVTLPVAAAAASMAVDWGLGSLLEAPPPQAVTDAAASRRLPNE